MWVIIVERLVLEALFDIVYWPVWWYTGGLVYTARKSISLVRFGNEWLSPGVWLRNVFVPMFGQHDWVGRLISFFMRLVNVFARGFALLVWTLLAFALFAVWLAIPPFVVYNLIKHV